MLLKDIIEQGGSVLNKVSASTASQQGTTYSGSNASYHTEDEQHPLQETKKQLPDSAQIDPNTTRKKRLRKRKAYKRAVQRKKRLLRRKTTKL